MKRIFTNNLRNLFAAAILITSAYITQAATYRTLTSGTWNDVVSVWSTDGITPCGCSPTTGPGDIVIIDHNITATTNITMNSAMLTVNAAGSINSTARLNVNSGSVATFIGLGTFKRMDVDATSTVNIFAVPFTVTSRMEIYGTVNIDGGYLLMTSGNMTVHPGATMNTINSGKVDIDGGNISNSGTFNICATCCFTTSGNWRNEVGGTVTGSGSATTTNGNMGNNGSWDINVTWCSAGSDFGMPSPEDCTNANATCGIILLPVELSAFDVELNGSGNPYLTWQTTTERDNDFFNVIRSSDGAEWEVVGTVQGVGTTTETTNYDFTDFDAENGVNYYRLEQVDFNGEKSYSEAVSALVQGATPVVFPNPASQDEIVRITNLSDESGQIEVMDATGKITLVQDIREYSNEVEISGYDLRPGMYIVRISQGQEQEPIRMVIQ